MNESVQELKDIHSRFIEEHVSLPEDRGLSRYSSSAQFKKHMHHRNGSLKMGVEVEDDPMAPLVIGRRVKIPEEFYYKDVVGEEGTISEIMYWSPLRGEPTMGFRIKWDNPQVERSFRTAYGMDRVGDTTNDIQKMIRQGFEIK